MKFPYLTVATRLPVPSLGGLKVRRRPVIAVQLAGPLGVRLRDGLLDTGSDDTVFNEDVAKLLGIDLTSAEERQVTLAGRPHPIRCRYAPVELRITDGTETCEWTATVGFVPGPLNYNLLGQAGFLQFFGGDFDGEGCQATLTPKPSLPGRTF